MRAAQETVWYLMGYVSAAWSLGISDRTGIQYYCCHLESVRTIWSIASPSHSLLMLTMRKMRSDSLIYKGTAGDTVLSTRSAMA